ncbi:DUF721 domain-containing protein [Candidatus Peregrinibacteria bacterium]|nr:DUF721 domain-containing protein [Candidatus Peregrinibacteria bacterium]
MISKFFAIINPYTFMFTQLKDLLPRATRKIEMERTLNAALVCEVFRQIRAEVLGDYALREVEPKHYQSKILTLSVSSSPAAQEIFFHKKELIELLNKRFGKDAIRDVRTIIETVVLEKQ